MSAVTGRGRLYLFGPVWQSDHHSSSFISKVIPDFTMRVWVAGAEARRCPGFSREILNRRGVVDSAPATQS